MLIQIVEQLVSCNENLKDQIGDLNDMFEAMKVKETEKKFENKNDMMGMKGSSPFKTINELKKEMNELTVQKKVEYKKLEEKLNESEARVFSLEKALIVQTSQQTEVKEANKDLEQKLEKKEKELEEMEKSTSCLNHAEQNEKSEETKDMRIEISQQQNATLKEMISKNTKVEEASGASSKVDNSGQSSNLPGINNDKSHTNVNEELLFANRRVSDLETLQKMYLESIEILTSNDTTSYSILLQKLDSTEENMKKTAELERALKKSDEIIASMKSVVEDAKVTGQMSNELKGIAEKELELTQGKLLKAESRLKQLEDIEQELLEKDQKISLLQSENETLTFQVKDGESKAFEKENMRLTTAQIQQKHQLELEMMKLKMKIEVCNGLNNQQGEEITRLKEKLRHADSQIKEESNEIAALKVDISNKSSRVIQLESLVKDYENVISTKELIEKDVKRLKEKLKETEEVASQMPEFQVLIKDYENLISTLRKYRIDLDEEVNNLRAHLQDSISRENDLKAKTKEMSSKLIDYDSKSQIK